MVAQEKRGGATGPRPSKLWSVRAESARLAIPPHPRMHRRALVPLLEIAPHPQTQQNVHQPGRSWLQDVRRRHELRPLGMSVGWMSGAATNLRMSLGLPDPQQKQHHLGKAAPDARHDSVGTQSDACPCWLARSDFVSGVVGVALSRSADCALLLRVHHCSVGKLHEVSTATQSCRWPVLESGGTSCAFASGRAVFWSHKRKEMAPLDLFQALERACRSARLADSATSENASKSPGSFARDCSAMDAPANTAKRSPATGRSWGAAGCTSYARTPTAQDVGWMDVRRCNQSANVLGFSKVSLIRSRNSTISERQRRTHDMIPLGRNPTHARVGLPGRISSRALLALRCRGLRIVRCSCVYITARLGNCTRSLQQRSRAGCLYWSPAELLALLHQVERSFGRTREKRWRHWTSTFQALERACRKRPIGRFRHTRECIEEPWFLC